jgi:hypothetical protein
MKMKISKGGTKRKKTRKKNHLIPAEPESGFVGPITTLPCGASSPTDLRLVLPPCDISLKFVKFLDHNINVSPMAPLEVAMGSFSMPKWGPAKGL